MHLFRRHRVSAVTIRAPQQQQITQTLQSCSRTRLNHSISALGIEFYGRDNRDRIAFRETTAQTGSHQHITNTNIRIRWQMLKLQIIRTTVTGCNHADIVAQHLDWQRVGRITNQQHATGQLSNGHHLTNNTFVADDRLAFINAINATFIDNNLIAIRIVNRGDNLSHHFLLILTQRGTQQLAQTRVLLFVLSKHQQFTVFQQQFLT